MVTCGPNAVCKPVNHRPQCVCESGYVGTADNVVNGCRKKETNECEFDIDCRDPTDVCKPMNDGLKKCFNACLFTNCGSGSHCLASNHTAFCECIGGFVRDSQASVCRPKLNKCNEDSHCPLFETCRSTNIGVLKCPEACIDFTCTPNSRCVSLQHKVKSATLASPVTRPVEPVAFRSRFTVAMSTSTSPTLTMSVYRTTMSSANAWTAARTSSVAKTRFA